MSNTLAIATVSGVLQARIRQLLDGHGMNAFDVAARPPVGEPDAGVYLHLFRVVPNAALQAESLPTRRRDGSVSRRPRLALNLHYQATFVGNTDNADFDAERLAGLVLTELHARPVLSPDEITAFLSGLGAGHVLTGADLGDQLDRVRISILAMDLEDHSRLWSMLNQSFHALTVGLEAAVVLLDDAVEPSVPLPVERANVAVFPIAAPQLESATSSARDQPIVQLFASGSPSTEALLLRGSGLAGPITRVRIGDVVLTPPAPDVSPTEIRVPLTDGSGVAAGVVSVQVIHELDVDPAPAVESLRRAGQSGSLAVALVPTVAPASVTPDGAEHLIELSVTPLPGADQDVQLLLDRLNGGGQLRSNELDVTSGNLRFRVGGLVAGDYLVRLIVDGATSLLLGGASGTPSPRITVP